MVKRPTERQRLANKIDLLSDAEIKEVLNYILHLQAMHRTRAAGMPREDELITLLAAAPENERARQAFEWEKTRRRTSHRTPVVRVSSCT